MKWLALIAPVVVIGCNAHETVEGDPDLAATLTTRKVAELDPTGVRTMELAALDEDRIAIARASDSGTVFCPDCTTLDPSECPQVCERSTITVATLSLATGELTGERVVTPVFPATYDHSVDQIEVVALGGDRVGVAWLDCDNARCGGFAARRSCDARYTTLDLATGTVGAVETLYQGWFGDLSLAFDPTSRRLLAVIGKDLAFGAGLFRAVYDEHAHAVESPWQPIGSLAAKSPALLAREGRLHVFADDWSPDAPPRAQPCAESCDCLDAGTVDLERGGLFAFSVDDSSATRLAIGRGPDGFYGRREQLAAIDAGGRIVVAGGQLIDRRAELFVFDGEAWTAALTSEAPIPLWIGALGTADHAAWIGAKPDGSGAATVQRLVAGISAGTASSFASIDDPLDRSVLLVEPVYSSAGVTTNVLLQGVFERSGSQISWQRFDVLAVDAAWP